MRKGIKRLSSGESPKTASMSGGIGGNIGQHDHDLAGGKSRIILEQGQQLILQHLDLAETAVAGMDAEGIIILAQEYGRGVAACRRAMAELQDIVVQHLQHGARRTMAQVLLPRLDIGNRAFKNLLKIPGHAAHGGKQRMADLQREVRFVQAGRQTGQGAVGLSLGADVPKVAFRWGEEMKMHRQDVRHLPHDVEIHGGQGVDAEQGNPGGKMTGKGNHAGGQRLPGSLHEPGRRAAAKMRYQLPPQLGLPEILGQIMGKGPVLSFLPGKDHRGPVHRVLIKEMGDLPGQLELLAHRAIGKVRGQGGKIGITAAVIEQGADHKGKPFPAVPLHQIAPFA